jgi:hypothetical protein
VLETFHQRLTYKDAAELADICVEVSLLTACIRECPEGVRGVTQSRTALTIQLFTDSRIAGQWCNYNGLDICSGGSESEFLPSCWLL